MIYPIALRTTARPHFRSGDFGFLLADQSTFADRLQRYGRSIHEAIRDRRFPLARALLVSADSDWQRATKSATVVDWDASLITDEGVRDVPALIAFEDAIASRLAGSRATLVRLPPQHPRRRFKTMKALADAVYGGTRHTTAHLWWLL